MGSENIIPAIFSIIGDDGSINKMETRKYIQFLLKRGIREFYINGSTGEAFMLSLNERKQILEIIKEEVSEDCMLMVQIGTISTKESIELAKHAEAVGVDIISAISPFYYKFSWDEVYAHYMSIVNSVNIRFCPYYIPHLSGLVLKKTQLNELLTHPQITHLKYTSNDFYMLQKLKDTNPEVGIFNGFDEMLLAGISSGADGAIGSTYNFTSKSAKALVTAVKQGNMIEARAHQNYINSFVDLLLDVGLWQGMKYLLSKTGVDGGNPHTPFLPISEAGKKLVDSFVQEHPDILE